MIRSNRVLALCLSCLIPLYAHSQAPVVDDSENFAILDEQQAANELPVAKAQLDYGDNDDNIPLAQDNDTDIRGNTELLSKLKGMQQEIQELRGQLEVQTHELKMLKQQQLTFYKDIDSRIQASSAKPQREAASSEPNINPHAASTPPPQAPAVQQVRSNAMVTPVVATTSRLNNPADEQISYLAAYDLVKNKRFDEALVAMQTFVSKYPKGGYTANAQYWLGELYMVQKNYPQAIEHFEIVLTNFASSSKAAACSLKIGYALASSGKKEEAKQRLKQVLKNYPDTPTAQLAATKLTTINAS